jgi:hypothetical protein
VLQPVITTTIPPIQASSKRIRITHLAEFSIGDRPPRAKGLFGCISPKPENKTRWPEPRKGSSDLMIPRRRLTTSSRSTRLGSYATGTRPACHM